MVAQYNMSQFVGDGETLFIHRRITQFTRQHDDGQMILPKITQTDWVARIGYEDTVYLCLNLCKVVRIPDRFKNIYHGQPHPLAGISYIMTETA